jgi:hypothetical protein
VTNDEYLQSQIMPMLQPGEQVLQTAYMRRQPGLLVQMLLVGGLLLYLITKVYFVVLTNRRMILIRTSMKFFSGGPAHTNLGIEEWDLRNIASCTTGGFGYNKSITWRMQNGVEETLRIAPIHRYIHGSKQFFEQVPQMFMSGQMMQLAAGAPPMQQLPPGAPPMQQQGGGAFPPGTRVVVTVQGGARHPATVQQAANGQYLCAMPDGQAYWFPMQTVSPG